MVHGVIVSTIAGVVGAVVWALIGYHLNLEIGWAAWGIGALVGFGMAIGAQKKADAVTGVIAACIALASIAGGKYIVATMVAGDAADGFAAEVSLYRPTENEVRVSIADEVVGEYEEAGKPVRWPEGMTLDEATEEADYPRDIWREMEKRWSTLSQEDRDAKLADMLADYDSSVAQARTMIESDGALAVFQENLNLFDLLWAALAVGTAFTLGQNDEIM